MKKTILIITDFALFLSGGLLALATLLALFNGLILAGLMFGSLSLCCYVWSSVCHDRHFDLWRQEQKIGPYSPYRDR